MKSLDNHTFNRPAPSTGHPPALRAEGYGRASLAAAVTTALALLAGCGGSGGGSEAPPPDQGGGGGGAPPPPPGDDSGGIDRGGVAIGVINGFGSVIVDGVRYDTTDATVTVDDEPATEDELRVGYKIRLTGTKNEDGTSGVATLIEYESEIEGPISSIDLAGKTLVVAGQLIKVRNDTLFDDDLIGPGLEALLVGDFIEVSGFIGADDSVLATRIELEDDRDEIEVTGFVRSLDEVNFTFTIGALTVDYSGAQLEDFDDGVIREGDLVEVEGSTFGAGGELIATLVEDEDDDDDDFEEGDFREIEGLITSFTSATEFSVNGRPVTTTDDTDFEGGTAADLRLNVRVNVEGALNADGILVAEDIDIEAPYNLEVEGTVEAVDLAADTLQVAGVAVRVDTRTRFEDDSDEDLRIFGLADLRVGDYVEVVGAADDSDAARILARSLERDDDEDEDVYLQGFVEAVDNVGASITVLGVTIVGEPGDDLFDDLLGEVQVGALIEVEGVLIGDGVLQIDDFDFDTPDDNDGEDEDEDDDDDDEDDD